MGRRALSRALVVVLSLGATLVLLEIPAYLGWVDWGGVVGMPHALRFTHLKPWDNPANIRDEELLFRHRPGMSFQGWTPGDLVDLYGIATKRKYWVDVSYDENGFRNRPGCTRADIVLIGDSFLEAGLVPQNFTVASCLEQEPGVIAQNLGCSGYGPQQEKIVLERYGLPLKPKVVVWFFFEGNDLLDVARYEEARQTGGQDPRKTRFLARSLLVNVNQRIALLRSRPRGEDSEEARRRLGLFPREDGPWRIYFAFPGIPLSDEDRANLVKAQETIRSAAELSRAAGARFILAFVPTKFRAHEGLVHFAPDTLCATWRANELPELLARFAADAGIEWLDLTPSLRAKLEKGTLVYLEDDGHWNMTGNLTAAEAIQERLR